ncbi:MAG TPA: hypothetical protein VE076_06135 [Nitrososphaeraceae archaeon]|jgi:hypothetical protein|nr:hypothetical protein [Nitrososphaeraceae archaeon]
MHFKETEKYWFKDNSDNAKKAKIKIIANSNSSKSLEISCGA